VANILTTTKDQLSDNLLLTQKMYKEHGKKSHLTT